MAAPASDPHTQAVIGVLEAAGLTVGDHDAPDPAVPPYSVVYLLDDLLVDGTAAAPDDDAQLHTQITSVGAGARQAEWEADRVRTALHGATLTVAGRSVQPVRLREGRGVARDDDVTPPLFYAVTRVAFWSFPV